MRIAVLGLVSGLLAASAAHAVGTDMGSLPNCRSPYVVKMLQARFASAREDFSGSGAAIARLAPISETGREGDNSLDRRFCQARAKLTDGKWPVLLYVIERRANADGFDVRYCLPAESKALGVQCSATPPRFAGP